MVKQFIRTQFEDDQGIALVVVMGIIALISVVTVSGYALATQSVHATDRIHHEEKAFQAASSGMDRVLADFKTDNFPTGQNEYPSNGTTPDGSYEVRVARSPGAFSKYSIISTGTAGSETARVRQDFYYFDLWAVNIGQGESPGRPPGAAGDFNGGPEIHGPFFVSAGSFNSNPDFYDGPLFVNGDASFGAGVGWYPAAGSTKYDIFAGGTCTGYDASKVNVSYSCPDIELPWIAADYMNAMLQRATEQSSDGKRGDGDPVVYNGEVSTVGLPSTYTGVRYPGQAAGSPYKVISGNLSITGASASFGNVTKSGTTVTGWDDFAYDTTTGTLYVEGIVYVNGAVTIGSGVQNYRGSGIIVSTGNATVDTGTNFRPANSATNGQALSANDTLAFVADNFTLGGYSGFEGTIFSNGTFELGKSSVFRGAVHAHLITNPEPPKAQIWMEEDMKPYKLPSGMPGGAGDPRPGVVKGGGVVIPGTWSRVQ